VQPKVKIKDPCKLSMDDFFGIYGSLIFQKYIDYCDKFTALDMETQMTPYIKVNFFTRKKKDGKAKNEEVHMLHNEVKVSEIVKYEVKRTNKITKMNTTAEKVVNRKHEVTYVPRVITSIETSEVETEGSRSRVIESISTIKGATAVYCNLVFSGETTETSTQTEPARVINLSTSCDMLNIIDDPIHDSEKSIQKLTACSTSSIHISAADHFVQLDEPRKPMYRHIKSRLGLGKLVEKPESIREMWLAQEIAMLRGQNLINWESKTDQLMGTLFHEQQPMTQPEVFSDQELTNQIEALTSDQEVLDMTAEYLNG
jgi:hypothetical protein